MQHRVLPVHVWHCEGLASDTALPLGQEPQVLPSVHPLSHMPLPADFLPLQNTHVVAPGESEYEPGGHLLQPPANREPYSPGGQGEHAREWRPGEEVAGGHCAQYSVPATPGATKWLAGQAGRAAGALMPKKQPLTTCGSRASLGRQWVSCCACIPCILSMVKLIYCGTTTLAVC